MDTNEEIHVRNISWGLSCVVHGQKADSNKIV
jgi:hypothetical protein